MELTLNNLTKQQRDLCPRELIERMVDHHGMNDLAMRDIGNFIVVIYDGRAIDGLPPLVNKFLSDLYQQEIDRQLGALEDSMHWDRPKAQRT